MNLQDTPKAAHPAGCRHLFVVVMPSARIACAAAANEAVRWNEASMRTKDVELAPRYKVPVANTDQQQSQVWSGAISFVTEPER